MPSRVPFAPPSAGRISVALALALAPAAAAAEPRERVTPPLVFTGSVGDGLWAYGQLDKAVLVYDDGDETDIYPFADNSNSSTRAGLWFKRQAADDFEFSVNVEYEFTAYSTSRVNRLDDDFDIGANKLRKAEAIFEVDPVGRFWVGQGSSASDAAAEADLSGTTLAAYSLVTGAAGGQLFALSGGGLSGVSVNSAFRNYDGGRLVRFRYDTPEYAGLRLGASVGRDFVGDSPDVEWDMALRYTGEAAGWLIWSGLGYARPDGDRNRLVGSASTLHQASGVSFTLAVGGEERNGGDDPVYAYAKIGWQGDLISAGRTFFGVDGYYGDAIVVSGSESMSFGLSAVQAAPAWQTDFYAVLRWHDYDDDRAGYENGVAVMTGLRFAF